MTVRKNGFLFQAVVNVEYVNHIGHGLHDMHPERFAFTDFFSCLLALSDIQHGQQHLMTGIRAEADTRPDID